MALVHAMTALGALGMLNTMMLAYAKTYEGLIADLGEKGTVRVGGTAINEVQHWGIYRCRRAR